MTNYAGQNILCSHDYPTYIDSDDNVRCDECDRVVGTQEVPVTNDEIDRSIWTSIGLSNALKGINERMYDAVRNEGKDVGVMIDGVLVAAFTRVDDRIVA